MYLAQVGLKIRNSVHVKSDSKWAESAVKSDGGHRMSYSQTLKFMRINPLQKLTNSHGYSFLNGSVIRDALYSTSKYNSQ